MSFEAWVATGVVLAVFAGLAVGRQPPHVVLLAGLAFVVVSGLVEPAQALVGFSNPGLVTVAVLFVVAAGLRQTGALGYLVQRALGRPRSVTEAQARLVAPVVAGSAFLNNTPVVAMLLPVVMDWSKSSQISPSKLLLPLSYLAILGGLCTLIGTSTNIVVNGLYQAEGHDGLGLFDLTRVGLPCALVGVAFLLLVGRRLLPDRTPEVLVPEDPRQYTVEMAVSSGGPLVGKTIEAAGLRNLPRLYLMEIQRGGHIRPMVDPTEVLEPGDQLIFVGVVEAVVDLQRIPGLEPTTRQVFELDDHRSERIFAEAVVSRTCPVAGQTIREGRFRNRYGAVVIAVSRSGERVPGRIGDIELRAGDALLLEASPRFVDQHRNARDFYLVSRLAGVGPPTAAQAPVALAILLGMVILAGTGLLSMLQAAFLAAAGMVAARCVSERTALDALDAPLLLSIGAAFGLGRALDGTGAAQAGATWLLSHAGTDPWLALVLVYVVATATSELVTNNAAAVIVFPIAMSTAAQLDANPVAFVVAVMVAASASFVTPLGYQTNLMVFGPGGYRVSDFMKLGLPMSVLVGATACTLIPWLWPL